MVSAILIINKRHPNLRFFVRVGDWVNDNLYVIDAKVPKSGEITPIIKSEFKAVGIIDESGDEQLFVEGVRL